LLAACSCKTSKPNANISYTGPTAVIYKTKADYSKNVPVVLSDDRSKVVVYPAPGDVYRNGKLAYPTALAKGFWLDNRGVSVHSAFLKLTYDEYAQLKQVPALDELYNMIIDKDPFTEMYNLGSRNAFKDEVSEINKIINTHQLGQYKKIK
jgi:hypothetical protein